MAKTKQLEFEASKKPANMLQLFWKELKHDKIAFSAFVLLVLILVGVYIGSPIINSQMDVMHNNLLMANRSPEQTGTLLGTDGNGRYVAPLLFVAARTSLNIGLVVTALSFVIGLGLGLISGFYGGKLDNMIMRFVDTWMMLPFLMVTIAIISILNERTMVMFIWLLTMFTWMFRARVIRAAALQQKNLDYIHASKTLGTKNSVIILRELLPNIVDVVVANFVITLAASIGLETGLSLLGFGLGIDTPSLGTMLQSALNPVDLQFRQWTWAPALILVVVIMLCINFAGNVLQRVADPKQRLT